ncbi:hypothetical protein VTL71DRAFT_13216 [Oculimacula yallundae]|uniref:Ankyrin n=1 Tax=Oculimacula yallundae TaxID=86028 RepID=A0ABR4CJP9_9HELO
MAISVLEFPQEILQNILCFAIITRRLKRGLRLRLVCKHFAEAVIVALFETRLLDYSHPSGNGRSRGPWQIKTASSLQTMFHRYLVYRVRNEKLETTTRLLELREIASIICDHSKLPITTVIDKICWLGFEDAFCIYEKGNWLKRGLVRKQDGTMGRDLELAKPNLSLNVLSAAAYFNLVPLATKLLSEGHSTDQDNYLFPPAMQAASWAGNLEIVRLFQNHIASRPGFSELSPTDRWLKLIGITLKGAAIRGNLDFLKLVAYHPAMLPFNHITTWRPEVGSIDRLTPIGITIYEAQTCTRSPEVHQYLQSFLIGSLMEQDSYLSIREFVSHCEWGNKSMVSYFLDQGMCVEPANKYDRTSPLGIAAQHCRHDVVDLLLERGADPNFQSSNQFKITALPMAASSGSLSMVRKLLDHGAYPNEKFNTIDRLPALWYAVATENTAMIELLESRGASFDIPVYNDLDGPAWVGGNAMEMAEELYLDSMVDLLKDRGIEIIERLNNTGCAPWQRWGLGNNPPRNNPHWAKYVRGEL